MLGIVGLEAWTEKDEERYFKGWRLVLREAEARKSWVANKDNSLLGRWV